MTINGLCLTICLFICPAALAGSLKITDLQLPDKIAQAELSVGRLPPGSQVFRIHTDGKREPIRVSANGLFVIAASKEQTAPIELELVLQDTHRFSHQVRITPREFPVEHVRGVPQATVTPDPETAARIAKEQAEVTAQRNRDDARDDFSAQFIWPVSGRISGRFGSQRVYNGKPGSGHSGMDIAAASGTAVKAPAAGLVTYANANMFLTGGTVLLDHGHGVSSNFLHLSRLDVAAGDYVRQGQVIGAVGATGRASGPHLHWGMNWFSTRIDPQTLVKAELNPQAR